LKTLLATLRNPMALNIALRLTLASLTAMSAATLLELQLPWWAAMAALMVGQPPRGLLLERGLAQLLGTLLGALAGALIVSVANGSALIALSGLALWIALCCGIANMMRHQRAYGAAVCGLTTVVIVSLTLGTAIDPIGFAAARALDTIVGIVAAIGVALLFGKRAVTQAITTRTKSVMATALTLIADAVGGVGTAMVARERDFLLALASLEASAEDAAAGSRSARRRLHEINTLFARLLDLIVVARAIRSQDTSALSFERSKLLDLEMAIRAVAETLAISSDALDLRAVWSVSHDLMVENPALSPVLMDMRDLLERVALGYDHLRTDTNTSRTRIVRPHPDFAGVKLAATRGALATLVAGLFWISFDWSPLRYLLLGSGIFTVLFSMIDDPAPAVRQIFLGGVAAACAAALWRLAIIPEVPNALLSLMLATPLVFCAALVQVERRTLFIGLAFNMLFAVLARLVDLSDSSVKLIVASEVMLLSGIALSYAFYRVLPMNTDRRREHLRSSVRKEIAAISIRGGTEWAERHLARLRYLVFSLAVRSQGRVQDLEDALSALSLGHVLLRLGDMDADPEVTTADREMAKAVLGVMQRPIHDTQDLLLLLEDYSRRNKELLDADAPEGKGHASRLGWLLDRAAAEVKGPSSIFVAIAAGNRTPRSRQG
jgi:uncharacterized membrane protein YccC